MALEQPEQWGGLRARYEVDQPRRMLALDGGGIRGILTLQVLQEIESQLRAHYNEPDLRLCQFFDYVSGTSTGAIIAAGVARGLSVAEILEFYEAFGQVVFTRRRWKIWNALYQNGPLEQKLKEVYGSESTLHPQDLKSLLLVVTRNATTDSAWPVTSNPAAKYNDVDRPDCNLNVPLWKLVRASTAAPVYFPPEVIYWEEGNDNKAFVFVDGGTTTYNNPAFLMARMATEPAYNLGWQKGERNLLVVSLGTGSAATLGASIDDPESNLASSAVNTLSSLMSQAAYDQDVNARTVGRCTTGDHIDNEVGDLIPKDGAGNPLPLEDDQDRDFLYARYNATLTDAWLAERGLGDIKADDVSALDSVDAMPDLTRIGKNLAHDVDLAHFGRFVDLPIHS
ncbi:MAG: patatin-like phospholipase family protein [Acidimicrobiales bacterium]